MEMICQIHNTPMVLKPAGIIKTGARAGQPYEAFWSCPVKAPDGSYCKFKPETKPTSTQAFTASLDADNREDAIKLGNAKNAAAQLMTGRQWTLESYTELVKYIYNLKL